MIEAWLCYLKDSSVIDLLIANSYYYRCRRIPGRLSLFTWNWIKRILNVFKFYVSFVQQSRKQEKIYLLVDNEIDKSIKCFLDNFREIYETR